MNFVQICIGVVGCLESLYRACDGVLAGLP